MSKNKQEQTNSQNGGEGQIRIEQPDPTIIPPQFDTVTEGYDPSKSDLEDIKELLEILQRYKK